MHIISKLPILEDTSGVGTSMLNDSRKSIVLTKVNICKSQINYNNLYVIFDTQGLISKQPSI